MLVKRITKALEDAFVPDWNTIRKSLDAECSRLAHDPESAPPIVVQRLLVSGEDHRHARHPGFDFVAICRACWRRFSRGTHEGASTIEQQVVRVLTGRYERTLARKLREIVLATLVARRYPKQYLPAVYLVIGYYGWRMNGYRQACRRLGLSPRSPSKDEAARLVARLKYPQPQTASMQRMSQIERRANHLCVLYRKHTLDGTYRHLNDQSIRNRPVPFEPLPQP